jgi:hypothetical protein
MAPSLLTSVLDGGEWLDSLPCRFISGERGPGPHWMRSWLGLRPGLDAVENRKILPLPGIEPRSSIP